MRIVHFFSSLDHGGAELRLLDALAHPDVAAMEHHAVKLAPRPGALDAAFEARGAQIHGCRLDRRFPVRASRLLRRLRPDVVHCNQQWMSGPLVALARANRVPGRVVQFHASADLGPTHLARRARDRVFRRLVLDHATAITGVAEALLDDLVGPRWRDDPRISAIHLGVDLARFDVPRARVAVRRELGIPREARVLIHVGNMGPAKDHPRLGALFAAVAARAPDVHLVAVGRRNPDFEDPMRAAMGRSGDRARITGPRDDVPRLLLAADAFVLPSRTEGLPTVLLEARAAGLPAVASDLPGIRETARLLPGIRTVSRAAPVDAWADAVLDALDAGADPHRGARNPLRGTPFDGATSARAHAALWRRSVERG